VSLKPSQSQHGDCIDVPRNIAPLEVILCTERLTQRPKRAADFGTESRALAALVQALADAPPEILQRLAETLLDVFKADSAGVSVLARDGKSFEWPAIAGAWRPHLGGGTLRDFGPCGDVLDRNAPLLFSHWELRYPYLMAAKPLAEEGLLVPFYVEGKAVGAILAIAHDDRRQFDEEDLRQLESLGRFASAAYQAVERRRAEESHNIEVREQTQLVTDVSESKHRIRELFNALPVAIYTTDIEGRITFFNRAAEEMAGRTPELGVDRWCVSWRLHRSDGSPLAHAQCPMAIAIAEQRPVRYAEVIAERPDGGRVPLMPFPTPLYDANGKFVGGVNMLVDMSQHKAAQAKEKRLIRELQHRSNNLLAVIQTIARGSLSGSQPLSQARESFEKRLHALARAHQRVVESDWSGVELTEIVFAELAPFAARARLDGPKIKLGPRRAQDLSLAVHELVTNAVKYGALSSSGGEVRASWHVDDIGDGRVLNFRWRERGGPIVAAPSRKGFGTVLLKSVLTRARFEYAVEGFSCEVDLPLSESESPGGADAI